MIEGEAKRAQRVWCGRLIVLILIATSVRAQDAKAPGTHVDRLSFPKAYRILTSERLIFPGDVSDWPVKIDSTRQLLVDDYLVSSKAGLAREFHQPVKHPANPLIVSDRPWEGPHIWMGSVIYDDQRRRFRMWYGDAKENMLYAESDDGITWAKPDLGIVEHEGSRENNIVIEGGTMRGMMTTPAGPAARQRFATLVWHNVPAVSERGFYVYHSPDGIHWTGELKRPALKMGWNRQLFNSVAVGDTSIFRYDPVLERYVCDAKFNLYLPEKMMKEQGLALGSTKNRIRCRTMSESNDLVHWTRSRFTFFPDEHDEPDTQMYGHIGFVYESMWLGVLRVMHIQRTGWKQVELELSYSRDGRHWSRPADRESFIPLGPPDSWDPDYSDVAHNGPLPVGDELWFYYRGSRNAERDKAEHYTMSIGLAKLRRDGFASLNAGAAPGQVITRPLTFEGKSLFINGEVTDGGWIKAAVLSENSEPIAHYRVEDAIPLVGDTVRGRMSWREAAGLVPAEDRHVRLMFQMKSAKLYSFWTE